MALTNMPANVQKVQNGDNVRNLFLMLQLVRLALAGADATMVQFYNNAILQFCKLINSLQGNIAMPLTQFCN